MRTPPGVSLSRAVRFPRLLVRQVPLLCFASLLSVFCACGGAGKVTPTPTPQVAIQVTAPAGGLAILATDSAQFVATVTGSPNTAVTWSVGEAQGGTIGGSGLYTAPAANGVFHVIATAQADPTKASNLAVTVTVAKPEFSSAPPVAALQGSPYSYALVASDPAGKP